MDSLISTKERLKERIKELTCLYKVSSLIANCDLNNLDPTLHEIALSLQEAILYSEDATVELNVENTTIFVGKKSSDSIFIIGAIKRFNKSIGAIKIGYSKFDHDEKSFLKEEQQLLNKVTLEIGNLFERKQIIENEIITKRQIERVDRLGILGEITAGIAHELNTPLANILGFAELLKEKFDANTEIANDLDKIINSAIFSREVVKKLMFFSCEMPQQKELINSVPIIRDAIGLLTPNFNKKALKVKLIFSQEDIKLRVDPIQLTQVIFNLVINAIYFSPKNGTIVIEVVENTKHIVLKISDEGSGIKPNTYDHIFNPFYTTKPVGEGSGLGLSVVHGIVTSHKGTIKHTPNSPKGTIFTIALPKP